MDLKNDQFWDSDYRWAHQQVQADEVPDEDDHELPKDPVIRAFQSDEGRLELEDRLNKMNNKKTAEAAYTYARFFVAGQNVLGKALIDNGNTLGNAVSEEFILKTGIRYTPYKTPVTAGTADDKGKLIIIGKVNKFPIRFDGIPEPITTSLYVIRNLSHPINFGFHFLSKHRMALDAARPARLKYNQYCVKLVTKNSPLLNLHSADREFANLCADVREHIAPGREMYCTIATMPRQMQGQQLCQLQERESVKLITTGQNRIKRNITNFVQVKIPGLQPGEWVHIQQADDPAATAVLDELQGLRP